VAVSEPDVERRAGLGHVVDVRMGYPVVADGVPKRLETGGLIALLLESGLADIVEVRPRVAEAPPPPGSTTALMIGAEVWSAETQVTAADGVLSVVTVLCDAEQACEEHRGRGPIAAPWEATAAILGGIVFALGRNPPPEAAADGWSASLSSDPYAVLIAGRAAAQFYGASPPVSDEALGDRTRDPLTRAVFLDPGIGPAWWLLGRRALDSDPTAASQAFVRASLGRPQSPAFLADDAFALARRERWDEAFALYETLGEVLPGDPRFVVPHARAALASGSLGRATQLLDGLPEMQRGSAEELELRVDLGEGTAEPKQQDIILAKWQAVAKADPEPVRRRIRLAVQSNRYEDALALVEALAQRSPGGEADALLVALGTATGKFGIAADAAERLGQPELSAELRARTSAPPSRSDEGLPPRPARAGRS